MAESKNPSLCLPLRKKHAIMNTSTIRQKLYEYIRVADDKKVIAIYTMIETDANELYEWWHDKELIADLDARSSDLKSGMDKGQSWEELKNGLLNGNTLA